MAVLLFPRHGNYTHYARRLCRRPGIHTRRRIAVTRFESCRQHDSRNTVSIRYAVNSCRVSCSG